MHYCTHFLFEKWFRIIFCWNGEQATDAIHRAQSMSVKVHGRIRKRNNLMMRVKQMIKVQPTIRGKSELISTNFWLLWSNTGSGIKCILQAKIYHWLNCNLSWFVKGMRVDLYKWSVTSFLCRLFVKPQHKYKKEEQWYSVGKHQMSNHNLRLEFPVD